MKCVAQSLTVNLLSTWQTEPAVNARRCRSNIRISRCHAGGKLRSCQLPHRTWFSFCGPLIVVLLISHLCWSNVINQSINQSISHNCQSSKTTSTLNRLAVERTKRLKSRTDDGSDDEVWIGLNEDPGFERLAEGRDVVVSSGRVFETRRPATVNAGAENLRDWQLARSCRAWEVGAGVAWFVPQIVREWRHSVARSLYAEIAVCCRSYCRTAAT